jgi:hypothetical protein
VTLKARFREDRSNIPVEFNHRFRRATAPAQAEGQTTDHREKDTLRFNPEHLEPSSYELLYPALRKDSPAAILAQTDPVLEPILYGTNRI